MGHKSDTPDGRVARIAVRQHGVVTLRQLEEAGVTREATYKRARRGRLHRLHRGVYAVGHRAPSHHARWMAAVLACGEGAVLSHGSAAALWNLLNPPGGPTHVPTPTTTGREEGEEDDSPPTATTFPLPPSSARSTTSTARS